MPNKKTAGGAWNASLVKGCWIGPRVIRPIWGNADPIERVAALAMIEDDGA